MSFCCTLLRATNSEVDRLLQNPEELDSFLDINEDPETGSLRGLPSLDDNDGLPVAFDDLARFTEQIDLAKNWHALHFLLTGQAEGGDEPWCYLFGGGTLIYQDEGSVVHALTSEQTGRFADALSDISGADLLTRMDPPRMTALNIYPAIWDDEGDDPDTLEWLLESFEDMKSFVQQTAGRQMGLVVYIG